MPRKGGRHVALKIRQWSSAGETSERMQRPTAEEKNSDAAISPLRQRWQREGLHESAHTSLTGPEGKVAFAAPEEVTLPLFWVTTHEPQPGQFSDHPPQIYVFLPPGTLGAGHLFSHWSTTNPGWLPQNQSVTLKISHSTLLRG